MNFDNYKTKLSWPDRPEAPVLGRNPTPAELRAHADALEAHEPKVVEYKRLKTEYQEDEARLAEEFKKDALEEVGLTGHPKADLVYSKAWEAGHSSGFSSVFYHLEDLSELVL